MPPVSHYVESFLGIVFTFSKRHDSQLLSRTTPSLAKRTPTISITSTELGASSPGSFTAGKHELLGDNKFPTLAWSSSRNDGQNTKSWLLVVEDPDSPMPAPGVHGIFYDIPLDKTSLSAEDFQVVEGRRLQGGFSYGQNRRGSVWIGPRPVISHGNHRYFFTVIGLSVDKLGAEGEQVTKEALDGENGLLKDKVTAWGEYIGNFERTL